MKKLLIPLLMLIACQANAQITEQTNIDTGITLLAGQTLSIGSSVRYGRPIYKDTLPPMYSGNEPLTLKTEKGGGDGSSAHPDTTYIWNHFEYMVTCVDKEMDYWQKASDEAYSNFKKTGYMIYYQQHVTAVGRTEYWGGVRAGMRSVLERWYYHSPFDYEFKTMKIKSRR